MDPASSLAGGAARASTIRSHEPAPPSSGLRQQNLRGEGAVLGVATQVAARSLDDLVDVDQPETVPLVGFGGAEAPTDLALLAARGSVGERDVQLRALHAHIHANHAIGFRQPVVGLDRVVEQVAEDAAQIEFRNAQLDRNMGVHAHVDAMRLCKRHLAAQNRVGHRIAGLDRGIQRLELGIETVR